MSAQSAAAPSRFPAAADGLEGRQRLLALIAILLSVAMATLDTAIANTALPTMAASLQVSEAQVIWVVNAYQLAMVAVLLPFAASGEILGHRRVFAAGTVLFTVASLVCGLADSLTTLVAARILQGLGGAAIMSMNMTLIRFVFPASQLGRGAGLNALVVGLAFTVGPTVASAVLAVSSWHWLFLINVPVGLVAVLFAARALPHTERHDHGFDRVAALLCAGLFGCAVLGFESLSHGGEWMPVCVEWAVAAVCGALLWRRQAGHPAPMVPVDLFRVPAFALSALTAICAFSAQSFGFVALPFLLQAKLGYSAVATGLLMTPWPAVVALMAPVAGPMADRRSPGLLGGIGLAAFAVGLGALALLPAHASVADIVWRTAVCGAGFGFFQAPNLKALMGSVPPRRSGGASGVVATSRLLGQTLGAGLVALCFHLGNSIAPTLALWLGCAFALAGSAASGLRLLPGVRAGATTTSRS
jgi:DHA2 family multidrug resistance protein-like MFS transporter